MERALREDVSSGVRRMAGYRRCGGKVSGPVVYYGVGGGGSGWWENLRRCKDKELVLE